MCPIRILDSIILCIIRYLILNIYVIYIILYIYIYRIKSYILKTYIMIYIIYEIVLIEIFFLYSISREIVTNMIGIKYEDNN